MRNIVLTGLSGSGKSSLGAAAAQLLDLEFIDMDAAVERRAGISIPEIFENFGEERFRELETEIILQYASRSGMLIATGGGAVTRPENIRALRQSGHIIFIDRPVEKIKISYDGSRPLLAGGAECLYKMSKERRHLYLSSADFILPNLGPPEETLAALVAAAETVIPLSGYAVIGDPISHSLSPAIHRAVFENLGSDETYRALHVPPSALEAFVTRVRKTAFKGFNVTLPHKRAIIPLLDEIDEEASLCGAVNTVVKTNGRLIGYNTDLDGLHLSLRGQGIDFNGRRVLVLGAGGAGGSIAFKAIKSGAAQVAILARRPHQADQSAAKLAVITGCQIKTGQLIPKEIATMAASSDLLINCTPLGMKGFAADFESFDFLKSLPTGAAVCDLIYEPPQTRLLLAARELGLKTINGLGMLIYQALLADDIFLNRHLDKTYFYKTVLKALRP